MRFIYVIRDSFVCATNSGVRGRFTCVPGVIHVCDLFVCGTWRVLRFIYVIRICDSFVCLTHLYVRLILGFVGDARVCLVSYMCVTCSYVGHGAFWDLHVWFICVTHSYMSLIRICDSVTCVFTHSCVWLVRMWDMRIVRCMYVIHMCDSFIYVTHSYLWLIRMC